MGTFVHCDSNGGNVTSIPGVTWGTGAAAALNGDLAIMPWVFLDTETPTDPTSQAWSLAVSNVSQDCEGRILYRVCNGTEAGDITGWSTTGTGNRQAAVLYVVRGYTAISGFKIRNEIINSTSHDCPALTALDGFGGLTPASGDTILVFTFDRAASTTASPPSGFGLRPTVGPVSVFAATGAGGTIVGIADDGLTDSATIPTTPGPWTGQASSDDAFTVTMSLRPSSTGITVSPAGIASEEAFGSPTITATLAVSPTGIGSVEAFGTPAIAATLTVSPSGIASAESVGSPTVAASLTVQPDGVASAEAFGTLTVQTGGTVSPDGIPTAEAFGVPTVVATLTVAPTGITSTEAFGTPTITATLTVSPAGVASGEAFGTLTISAVPLRDVVVTAKVRNNHVTGGVRLTGITQAVRSNHITGGIDVSRTLRTGSVEYVVAEVTFVGETAASIATATGQVQITTTDTTPTAADPNWVNPDVTTRTDVTGGAKLSLQKLHTAGTAATYRLWAKVTDNPEVPILLCGSFDVR